MHDIINKINILKLPKESLTNIDKFYTSFSDDLISLDELKEKLNYLNSKGISITKPSQVKIFALPFEFIKEQVEQAERLGLLDIFKGDPIRITSKEIFKRYGYFMSLGEHLKDEKGKYNKVLFNKKEFDRRYGNEYLSSSKEVVISEEEPVEKNINDDKTIDNKSIISDIGMDFTQEKFNDLNNEIEQVMNSVIGNPVVSEPITSPDSLPVVDTPVETGFTQEVTPPAEEVNPYIMALSKEQTIRLDDEMLAKFEDLTAHLKNVLITLGYSSEIDGTKSDNLIKLLTSGIGDEREILYYTLTYNKNLTDDEKVSIYNAIDNELKLTNNGELSL